MPIDGGIGRDPAELRHARRDVPIKMCLTPRERRARDWRAREIRRLFLVRLQRSPHFRRGATGAALFPGVYLLGGFRTGAP